MFMWGLDTITQEHQYQHQERNDERSLTVSEVELLTDDSSYRDSSGRRKNRSMSGNHPATERAILSGSQRNENDRTLNENSGDYLNVRPGRYRQKSRGRSHIDDKALKPDTVENVIQRNRTVEIKSEEYLQKVNRWEEGLRNREWRRGVTGEPQEAYCNETWAVEWNVCRDCKEMEDVTKDRLIAIINVNKGQLDIDDDMLDFKNGEPDPGILSTLSRDPQDYLITEDEYNEQLSPIQEIGGCSYETEIVNTYIENTYAGSEYGRESLMTHNETFERMGQKWDSNSIQIVRHESMDAKVQETAEPKERDNSSLKSLENNERERVKLRNNEDVNCIQCTSENDIVKSTLDRPGVLSLQAVDNVIADATYGIQEAVDCKDIRGISEAHNIPNTADIHQRMIQNGLESVDVIRETIPESLDANRDSRMTQDPFRISCTAPVEDVQIPETLVKSKDEALVRFELQKKKSTDLQMAPEVRKSARHRLPSRVMQEHKALLAFDNRKRKRNEFEKVNASRRKDTLASAVNSAIILEKSPDSRGTKFSSETGRVTRKRNLSPDREKPFVKDKKRSPKLSEKLFKGMTFLLSGFQDAESKTFREKLKDEIVKHAGTIEISEDITEYSGRYFVISHNLSKSWKALYALAWGHPIIKSSWIREAIDHHDVRNTLKQHLWLPSKLNENPPFQGINFFLDGGEKWKKNCLFVLEKAGGAKLTRLPHANTYGNNIPNIVALFEDMSSKKEIIKNYERRNIPSRDGTWVFDILRGAKTMTDTLPVLNTLNAVDQDHIPSQLKEDKAHIKTPSPSLCPDPPVLRNLGLNSDKECSPNTRENVEQYTVENNCEELNKPMSDKLTNVESPLPLVKEFPSPKLEERLENDDVKQDDNKIENAEVDSGKPVETVIKTSPLDNNHNTNNNDSLNSFANKLGNIFQSLQELHHYHGTSNNTDDVNNGNNKNINFEQMFNNWQIHFDILQQQMDAEVQKVRSISINQEE